MIRFAALRTGLLMLLAGPLVADSTSSDPLPVHLLTGGGNALGFPLTTTLNSPAPGGHPAEQAGGAWFHDGSVIPQTSPQSNENELLELDDGRLLFSTRTPSGSPTTVNPAAFCACVSCAERHPDRMLRGSFPCRRALPGTRPA